jgi:hypothetical protein
MPPPVGAPTALWLKVVAMGVGSEGIAGILSIPSLPANCELRGVLGEKSDPSSALETERVRLFRFFKLEDEKFFRNPDLD